LTSLFFLLRYIVRVKEKIRSIDAIFQRDEHGHYTKHALFYQDILRYYFIINKTISENNHFHLRDLQKWIVENNLEMVKYFQGPKSHTSPSNKIHIKEGQINHKFEDLIQIGLIHKVGQETYESIKKIQSVVDIYEYTKQGIFLILIIKSMNLENEISLMNVQAKQLEKKKELEHNNQTIYDLIAIKVLVLVIVHKLKNM
jgi:hypothetical protein